MNMAKKTAAKKTTKKTAAKKKAARKPAAKKSTPRKAVKKAVKKAAKKTAKKTVKRAAKKSPVKKAAKKAVKKAVKKKPARKPSVKKAGKKAPAKVEAAPVAKTAKPRLPRLTGGMYGGVVVCDNPGPLPKKSPYSKREQNLLNQKLLEERGQARKNLAALDKVALSGSSGTGGDRETPGYSTHPAEYASDYQAAETSLDLRAMEETRLAQVSEALQRMETGLYGVCVACAAKIGYQRLSAKPFAVLCIKCRENYEKRRVR